MSVEQKELSDFDEFMLAVENGNIKEMEAYFQKDFINKDNTYGRMAIHSAATCGNIDVFKYVMTKGGDAFMPDKYGRTPLHYAAAHANLNIVKYLISQGANANTLDTGGCAPIHYAAACPTGIDDGTVTNLVEVVQYLIVCGANVELKTIACRGRGCSNDNILCKSGDIDKVFHRDLYPYRGYVADNFLYHGMRPAHLACVSRNVDVLQCLLVSGCMMNVNEDDSRAQDDFESVPPGLDGCHKLLTRHKAERQNVEYSVWNFKDVSVIIRNFKIFCISSVIDAIKMNILAINSPVIFIGVDGFNENCYKTAVKSVLHLASKKFQYNEHVVVDDNESINDVLLRLERCRGWKCGLRYPGTKNKIPQKLLVAEYLRFHSSADAEFQIETAIKWIDGHALSMTYCDETPFTHSAHYADTLFVWSHDYSTYVRKTVIEAFQKSLLYGINQNKTDDSISKYLLMRLATNKADLLLFLSGNEIVRGSTTIGDLLNKQVDIRIHQKFRFNSVDFLLDTEEAILREMSNSSGNHFVLKPIFPYHPLIVGPSSRDSTVDEVKMALTSLLKVEDVILLYNGRIPKGVETLPKDADNVMDYATISSFPKMSERKQIGRGGFGTVFKCKEDNSDYFALKVISMSNDSGCFSDMDLDKTIIRELIIAAKVPAHDRIMSYQAFYEEAHTFDCVFCIRMPLMENSLSGLLHVKGSLPEKDIRHFSNQILQGLNHLHQNKVMHRDLKGQNVLFDKNRNVKLCDFGLSKYLNDLASSAATKSHVGSQVGTVNWRAPEVMREPTIYGIKADVWSFGATIVEMITGQPPYAKYPHYTMLCKIMEGEIEYEPPNPLSEELKSFADSCLRKEPNDRPSCFDLLQHPFLTN